PSLDLRRRCTSRQPSRRSHPPRGVDAEASISANRYRRSLVVSSTSPFFFAFSLLPSPAVASPGALRFLSPVSERIVRRTMSPCAMTPPSPLAGASRNPNCEPTSFSLSPFALALASSSAFFRSSPASGSTLAQYWLFLESLTTFSAKISPRMRRRALPPVVPRLSQYPNTSDVGASLARGSALPWTYASSAVWKSSYPSADQSAASATRWPTSSRLIAPCLEPMSVTFGMWRPSKRFRPLSMRFACEGIESSVQRFATRPSDTALRTLSQLRGSSPSKL